MLKTHSRERRGPPKFKPAKQPNLDGSILSLAILFYFLFSSPIHLAFSGGPLQAQARKHMHFEGHQSEGRRMAAAGLLASPLS